MTPQIEAARELVRETAEDTLRYIGIIDSTVHVGLMTFSVSLSDGRSTFWVVSLPKMSRELVAGSILVWLMDDSA